MSRLQREIRDLELFLEAWFSNRNRAIATYVVIGFLMLALLASAGGDPRRTAQREEAEWGNSLRGGN